MTTGNRNIRSPGRTPPFILVGLLVAVVFLGYSYWSLSSSHSELAAQLESVQVLKKEIDQRRFETEKNLEDAREELLSNQASLEQARKDLQDKESEIAILRTDLNNKQVDAEKFQSQLSQCDTSLSEHRSSLDALKYEKGELNRLLTEAQQRQPVCNIETCTDHVKSVLAVVAKLLSADVLGKALSEANFDANKLMEGIQFVQPVVQLLNIQPLQGQNQQQQQQAQNQQQQAVDPNKQAAAIPNPQADSQVRDSNGVANDKTVKEVNITMNSAAQPKTDKGDGSTLAVQSERNKNIADIANLLAKEELERHHKNEAADNPSIILENGEVDETGNKKADVNEEDEAEENLGEANDSQQVDEDNI